MHMNHTYTSTFIAYNVEVQTVPATVLMMAIVWPMGSVPAAASTPTVPAEWSQVELVREKKRVVAFCLDHATA